MKWKLKNIIKNTAGTKALVLMYHRIAESKSDVWDIAVSPANFEHHLQVLQKIGNVISIKNLVSELKKKSLKNTNIAIAFDDGYADNFFVAKPLLQKYNLPATFFITSSNIGTANEFWWDELEWIFLFAEKLPQLFSMVIGKTLLEYSLKEEEILTEATKQKHAWWKAFKMPETSLRSKLFLAVWEQLKPLTYVEQQLHLIAIRKWAGTVKQQRPDYRCMNTEQLHEMTQTNLFDIGMHSASHAALAFHDREYQKKDLLENQKFLQNVTGKEIQLLAYPYGNYNNETVAIAEEIEVDAAFTTEKLLLTNNTDKYRLGRFQVENWRKNNFEKIINSWLTGKDHLK